MTRAIIGPFDAAAAQGKLTTADTILVAKSIIRGGDP